VCTHIRRLGQSWLETTDVFCALRYQCYKPIVFVSVFVFVCCVRTVGVCVGVSVPPHRFVRIENDLVSVVERDVKRHQDRRRIQSCL